ncbi:MAG: hypothetical protein AAF408_03910, partial [Pseudomonadota bacterium]
MTKHLLAHDWGVNASDRVCFQCMSPVYVSVIDYIPPYCCVTMPTYTDNWLSVDFLSQISISNHLTTFAGVYPSL